jgi:hypothetical protein
MDMDYTVNRLLAWARTLEKALHGHGPWTFHTSAGVTTAHRLIERDKGEIFFMGQAVPTADGTVELWLDDELVALTYVDFSEGTWVTWRLRPERVLTA